MLNVKMTKQLGQMQLNVNVQLPMQGVTAVFGRSGAGKTTFINLLGGLTKPDTGLIQLGNKVLYQHGQINLPPEKRHIGYVFQEARLFPHYRVRGNLNYGVKQKDPEQFNKIVKLLGITHLLDAYPATLSGGEKQRVAIGRALLTQPEILLMDEPLASLDLPRKRELLPFLQALSSELKLPIIYVSHSLDEILQLANHMLLLDNGKVLANDSLAKVWNSDLLKPWQGVNEHSALLSAKVAFIHEKYPMTQVVLNDGSKLWVTGIVKQFNRNIQVRIFAHHVSICIQPQVGSSIRNSLEVQIVQVEQASKAELMQLKLQLGSEYFWANITPWAFDELQLAVGKKVYAQIKGVNMNHDDMAQTV